MYKNYVGIVLLFLHVNIYGGVYEKNCLACHQKLQVGIDKFFYRYLLTYSSEKKVKEALKEYLKHPKKEKSLLADGLILRFGVKKPTKLSEKELNSALDTYWQKYNLIGKLH